MASDDSIQVGPTRPRAIVAPSGLSGVEAKREVLFALFHAALWAPSVYVLVVVVPRYKRIFADFGMKLPWLTMLLIDVSDWVVSWWFLILFLPGLLILADVLVICWLRQRGNKALGLLWLLLWTLLPGAVLAILWIAINEPLLELMDALSK